MSIEVFRPTTLLSDVPGRITAVESCGTPSGSSVCNGVAMPVGMLTTVAGEYVYVGTMSGELLLYWATGGEEVRAAGVREVREMQSRTV